MARPEERRAPLGLAALLAISALFTLILGRDLSFVSDELGWLTFADDLEPGSILTPHNSHLIALPRVLYEVLPQLFGTSYLPFRLAALVAVLACGALFYALARERVGAWAALAPTGLLLFFGVAPVIAISPLGIPFTLSIAFGLAALEAVERSTLLVACGLLVLSILSHTFGVIFAGGALVYVLLARQPGRSWVAALPLGLWAAWWLWAQQFDQGIADSSNLAGAPLFMLESAAAAVASLVGSASDLGGDDFAINALGTAIFVGAVLVGAVLLAILIRGGRATPWLWAYLAMAAAFWLGTALSEAAERQPTTPRYLFFGALIVLLIGAEALRGVSLRRPAGFALAALLALGLLVNGVRLVRGATELTSQAEEARAQLAMLELAGPLANPAFSPRDLAPRGSEQVAVPAGTLSEFSDEVGGLGYPLEDVRELPEPVRRDADLVLARALGLLAVPAAAVSGEAGPGCRLLESAGEQVRVELPAGGHILRLVDGVPQPLLLGRFADSASVPVGDLGTEDVALILPADAEPEPWFAEVAGSVRTCPLKGNS